LRDRKDIGQKAKVEPCKKPGFFVEVVEIDFSCEESLK
jgi:hypothetical protein